MIGLLDSAGTEVVRYTYDAWGKPLATTGSLAGTVGANNPFRYRGYVYDAETEQYYLRSRYYNPAWGRFISADSLLGKVGGLFSHNAFAYCLNNPVNKCDPNGMEVIDDALANSGGNPMMFLAALIYSLLLSALFNEANQSLGSEKVRLEKEMTKEAQPDVTIYRYGFVDRGMASLVPSTLDVQTNSGLSFSTKPRLGAAVTTINTLNNSGFFIAIQDKPTHVAVYPVGTTLELWNDYGVDSFWTQILRLLVVVIE